MKKANVAAGFFYYGLKILYFIYYKILMASLKVQLR